MLKILSIGNSFSQDAQRYLYGVGVASGKELYNQNLYIGGCSLERHANNVAADLTAYGLERFGERTGRKISIDDALRSHDWDIVTLQQASHVSFDFSTYEPYLSAVAKRVRMLCPYAKLYLHQTWSYEDGSERLAKMGYATRADMFADVRAAYEKAALSIGADGIIPSGQTMEYLAQNGVAVHRDTFHASLGVGRYALALTWLKALFGSDTKPVCFFDFDEPVCAAEQQIAEQCARMAVEQ